MEPWRPRSEVYDTLLLPLFSIEGVGESSCKLSCEVCEPGQWDYIYFGDQDIENEHLRQHFRQAHTDTVRKLEIR